MLVLHATVTWFSPEQGGLGNTPFSGIQPSFAAKGELIMCRIWTIDGSQHMAVGVPCEVKIELPYGENYRDLLSTGYEFNLNVGSRVIGCGRVA
jgi:hypothetical protein